MIPTRKMYKRYDEDTVIKRSKVFSQVQFYKNIEEIKWALLGAHNFDVKEILPGYVNPRGFQEYDNLLVSTDDKSLRVKYYFRKCNAYGLEYKDRDTGAYPEYLINSVPINLNMLDRERSYYFDVYIYGILDEHENLDKVAIINWTVLEDLWARKKIRMIGDESYWFDCDFSLTEADPFAPIVHKKADYEEYPVVDTYYNENYSKSFICLPITNFNTSITRKFPGLIPYKRGF